jgi:hypothetical protein
MKQSSKNVLWIALVIIVAFVAYRVLFPPAPSDQIQIQNNIQKAIDAAQARDANGIMSVVSEHYVDENGWSNDALKFNLVRAFNQLHNLSVSANPSDITINPNGIEAHSVTYVTLVGAGEEGRINSPRTEISLTWAKEPATRFLFIPTKAWRVVKASYGSFD